MRYMIMLVYSLSFYAGKTNAEPPLLIYSTYLGAYQNEAAETPTSCDVVADVDDEGNFYIFARQPAPADSTRPQSGDQTVHRLMRINQSGTYAEPVMTITGTCHIRRIVCHPVGYIYIEYGTPDGYILEQIAPDGREIRRLVLPFSPSCSYIDPSGYVYIAGSIDSGNAGVIPVTADAMYSAFIGGTGDKDMFLMRYGPDFDLEYCSFMGGSELDYPVSIIGDSDKNIVVSCNSLSHDCACFPGEEYPTQAILVFDVLLKNLRYGWRSQTGTDYLPSGYDTTYDPGTGSIYDVGDRNSIYKFTSTGQCLWAFSIEDDGASTTHWSNKASSVTMNGRLGRGIAIGEAGDIYYTMDVDDSLFPVTTDALDPSYNGGPYDVTVSHIRNSGELEYATYFGGSGADKTSRMATAFRDGVFYCAGITSSRDFPTTLGAYIERRQDAQEYCLFAFAMDFMGSTGIEEQAAALPAPLILDPPYPNPFNPVTTISFTLPEPAFARLSVYSISGQLERELVAATLPAGRCEVVWDGCDADGLAAGSGVYIARLVAGNKTAVRKVMLVR